MKNIIDLITLGVKNEHDLEHDSLKRAQFSEPKIYDAHGDITKRWYVYFSFLDPKTGKLKRMKNIYGKVNRYKNKEARYYLLSLYKRRLLYLLKLGYNPFKDNSQLYKSQQQSVTLEPKKTSPKLLHELKEDSHKNQITHLKNDKPLKDGCLIMSVKSALDYALNLKTNLVNTQTFIDYKNRCDLLKKWLLENYEDVKTIDDITKTIIIEFLNEVQLRTSPRNRNNYRTCFSSIFQVLVDNEIINKNFIKEIKPLKTNPERNKTYSEQQQQEIFEYLKKKDPILLLFIKFISYNFLRPIEVCRLKVKDVNLTNNTLQFRAKNKRLKTKLIPSILLKDLPDLSSKSGEELLFTPTSIGGIWDVAITNRRGYFTNRFKNVVKDHFGFGLNYGLYSFRHTFITKLYKSLAIESSPFAAKSTLMQITGHSTMTALEKYLRDIDAELPNDYSNFLE